jgi:hypothetical protein
VAQVAGCEQLGGGVEVLVDERNGFESSHAT